MSKIKIAAFDLDDTLLDKNNKIPEQTLHVLNKAWQEGVIITLVSGRAYPSARKIADELGFDVPIICYNGAMIKKADSSAPIFVSYLEEDTIHRMIDYCHMHGLYLQMYDEQNNIVVEKINEKTLADPDYYNTDCREVGDFVDFYKLNEKRIPNMMSYDTPEKIRTPKMMIFDTPNNIGLIQTDLEKNFNGSLYFTQSKDYLLEMMAPGVNKAVSLARFAESLSYSAKEVMACGDNANDIEMVKWAGVGVAVANATPELKAVADYVCEYERSAGAAEAIEKFVLHNKS